VDGHPLPHGEQATSTSADLSRSNTFVLLGNMPMRILPYLSRKQRAPEDDNNDKEDDNDVDDDWVDGEDLSDLVRQTASLAGENLRHGRRGRVSALFEKTLQTVTYLSNHMQTDEWKGDKEFGMWASETLLAELEKVGAAGASLQNQNATRVKFEEDEERGKEGEEEQGEEEQGEEQEEEQDEEQDEEEKPKGEEAKS
jgi:hypothetical protein